MICPSRKFFSDEKKEKKGRGKKEQTVVHVTLMNSEPDN